MKYPMLSIILTDKCNQRCFYCPPMGEGHICNRGDLQKDFLRKFCTIAFDIGFRAFRLSGGEPTLYKEFESISNFFGKLKQKGAYTVLNTNAQSIKKYLTEISEENYSQVRISLDTLDKQLYQKVNKSKLHDRVLQNIDILSKRNNIRINSLVYKSNYGHLNELIEFCERNSFELKLLDFEKHAFDKNSLWEKEFICLRGLREDLRRIAQKSSFEYSWGEFGMITEDFYIKKNKIRVKDSTISSTYHPTCTESCELFPCPEGAYALILTPDSKITWCRRRPELTFSINEDNIEEVLIKSLKSINKSKMLYHKDIGKDKLGKTPLLEVENILNNLKRKTNDNEYLNAKELWTVEGARYESKE
jgi:molybdenum cofactor biosynthesis enzyme MoaA